MSVLIGLSVVTLDVSMRLQDISCPDPLAEEDSTSGGLVSNLPIGCSDGCNESGCGSMAVEGSALAGGQARFHY